MDSDDKTRITIDIFGTQYKFVGQTSSSHIRMIAAHVNGHMKKIADSFPQLDTTRVAVLAAVNMAEEKFKLKDDWDQERKAKDNTGELAEYRKLQAEHEKLRNEYRIGMERVEEHKQKEQSLMNDYRILLQDHETLKEEMKAARDSFEREMHGDDSVHENYRKLQEEYKKLQNEYNEWVELSERDQPRNN